MKTVEFREIFIPVYSKKTKEKLGNISIAFFPRMETIILPDKDLEDKLSREEWESLRRQIFENVDKWVRTMEIG